MISKEAENAGQEQQFLNSKGSSMAFKVFSRQALLQAFAKQAGLGWALGSGLCCTSPYDYDVQRNGEIHFD
ncbi:rps2 [Symbiodinium necroappetens]|uniref:Rps2 protein n=1 Tax=Symbiodinium necroappetens TaxID=1628268 RepID=A0A813BIV3_9DINO|nr:rps2 [Symbiodinium necroappetens]